MDVGWLEDYLALRELGSFTAAAKRRNSSQPAFSRRIQALEAWLGVTLVDRSCRPHRFTPVAIEYDAGLRDLLSRLYDLRSQLRGQQTLASRLRVAVQHSLSLSLFPRLVETLRQNGFQPVYRLSCGNREDCIEMLLRGEADLLICSETADVPAPVPAGMAERFAAGSDDMVLVGAPAAIGPDGGLPPEGSRLPLLIYPQSSFFGQIIWNRLMPRLAARFEIETVCVSSFSSALREMVLAGLGLAWLPRDLVGEDLRCGRLAALEPDTLRCPLETAVYARLQAGRGPDGALGRLLAAFDPRALRAA